MVGKQLNSRLERLETRGAGERPWFYVCHDKARSPGEQWWYVPKDNPNYRAVLGGEGAVFLSEESVAQLKKEYRLIIVEYAEMNGCE